MESGPVPETKKQVSPFSNEINWSNAIIKNFLSKPGEHLIEIGITGSGKTQGLYHLLNGIIEYSPDETILWITCGKSAEELKLMQFAPTNFLFPIDRAIEVELKKETYPFTSYEFLNIPDIFKHIDKDKLNILCLAPYFPDPEDYAILVTEFFKALITLARDGKIPTPLAIFIDEFQMVAPAQGQSLNDQHNLGGRWMQRNLDQLRSIGIRIVGAAQAWKKIRGGVRTAFSCIMIRQGAEFPNNEIPRLAAQNDRWQSLDQTEMVFAFRNRFYSDIIQLPKYGDGTVVGTITYLDFTDRQRVNEMNIDDLIDSFKKKSQRRKPEEESD